MSSRICSERLDWKKAYSAALVEKDRTRLPALVDQARQKLSERLHELLVTGPVPSDEIDAIDEAIYLLHALLSSLSYRDENREWTRSVHDSI